MKPRANVQEICPRSLSPRPGLTPGGLIPRTWAWPTARLQLAVLEEREGGAQGLLERLRGARCPLGD